MPRKKNTQDLIAGENVAYCRKCQNVLPAIRFYETTNPALDSNGKMSICRQCCSNLYDAYFSVSNNIEKAIYLTCEDLDVRFSNEALSQTLSHVESAISSNRNLNKVFGIYKSKLGSISKENEGILSFRFKDSSKSKTVTQITENILLESKTEVIDPKLSLFWGNKFNIEDLTFLEQELYNWKETHRCDNNAELVLIKEICMKQLEIRTNREEGKSVTSPLGELQNLMKTASLDPAKSKAASAGKSHESWGMHVKDVEELTPAEWFDQQDKYRDIEGFDKYLENYVARPIRNFFSGDRNFSINEDNGFNIGNIEDVEDGDE